ncbi:MAG: sugar transferase [Candidatus Acidiferrum sp.]
MPIQINVPPANELSSETSFATARPRREWTGTGRLAVVRPPNRWYLRGKAVAEYFLAALLSVMSLPIIAICALAVKLTSPGPAFYSQTRVGKGGRLFAIRKIRTMVHNCESLTGPRWCLPGDPRITKVGWFLRISHLDELPQLFNVLRGEMALIGPRPERPEFVPQLERALPAFRQRLMILPGVTGLAQVRLPADTDIDSVRRKLAHDLWYIERMSAWLDLRVLMATALYAIGMRRSAGIPGSSAIERSMQSVVGEPLTQRGRLSA